MKDNLKDKDEHNMEDTLKFIWFLFIIHIKHNKKIALQAAKVRKHTDLQAVTSHHAFTRMVSS